MKEVAYLIAGLEAGGAEGDLLYLLQNLDREQIHPRVYTWGNGSLGAQIRALGIPLKRIARRPHLWDVLRLLDHLNRYRCEILHTVGLVGGLVGRLAAQFLPRLLTIHQEVQAAARGGLDQRPFFRALEPGLHQRTDRFLAKSKAVLRYLLERGAPSHRIYLLPEATDLAPFLSLDQGLLQSRSLAFRQRWNIPPEAPLVGAFGRFRPEKGFERFLDAAAALRRETPTIRFVLGGDGPLRQELEKKAHQLQLGEDLIFTGMLEREDLAAAYAACQMVVVPSLLPEGFGNVAWEALAAARPVIASNIGALAESITHGETGLLVPSHSTTELILAVRLLLQHPDRAQQMGFAGRSQALRLHAPDQYRQFLKKFYTS